MCEHPYHHLHTLSLHEADRARLLVKGMRLLTGDLRADDPLTLEWLLSKESLLAEELEPKVSEIGAHVLDEILSALDDLRDLEGELTEADVATIEQQATAMLQKVAKDYATDAAPLVGQHAASAYQEVRTLLGTIGTSYHLPDQKAIAWMKKDPALWVEKHFADDVTEKVREISTKALDVGWGRSELADVLEDTLKNEVQGYSYWETLAAANLNRSRTWGAYESMVEQGVTTMAWFAMGDERMCPTCGALDGTLFSVQSAVDHQRAIVADDLGPDDYVEMSPWVSVSGPEGDESWYWKDAAGQKHDVTDTFNALTPGKADSGAKVQELGIQGPPVHGRCRCLIEPVD